MMKTRLRGCILGTAIGDAVGLPREGLTPQRAAKLFGDKPLSQRLFLGRGLCSDDTEHTVMTALALLDGDDSPATFAHNFARRLRWWFLRFPAGVGFGTARACLKLWIGFSPAHSGVKSAGNGPAMRSALLGVVADSPEALKALVAASTAVTHADDRARQGAELVATAAYLVSREGQTSLNGSEILEALRPIATDEELAHNMGLVQEALRNGDQPEALAKQLHLHRGVSGFVNHTVPIAIYCWVAHRGSYRDAVESAVCLGGDSDTVAAITGALAGSELGADAIPEAWLQNLAEWPCGRRWLTTLCDQLAERIATDTQATPVGPIRSANPIALTLRNIVFLSLVLGHGFRRLAPPY